MMLPNASTTPILTIKDVACTGKVLSYGKVPSTDLTSLPVPESLLQRTPFRHFDVLNVHKVSGMDSVPSSFPALRCKFALPCSIGRSWQWCPITHHGTVPPLLSLALSPPLSIRNRTEQMRYNFMHRNRTKSKFKSCERANACKKQGAAFLAIVRHMSAKSHASPCSPPLSQPYARIRTSKERHKRSPEHAQNLFEQLRLKTHLHSWWTWATTQAARTAFVRWYICVILREQRYMKIHIDTPVFCAPSIIARAACICLRVCTNCHNPLWLEVDRHLQVHTCWLRAAMQTARAACICLCLFAALHPATMDFRMPLDVPPAAARSLKEVGQNVQRER